MCKFGAVGKRNWNFKVKEALHATAHLIFVAPMSTHLPFPHPSEVGQCQCQGQPDQHLQCMQADFATNAA